MYQNGIPLIMFTKTIIKCDFKYINLPEFKQFNYQNNAAMSYSEINVCC